MVLAGVAGCGDSRDPVSPIVPAQLVALTSTDIVAVAGSEVIPAPMARVLDSRGAPVGNVSVTFELAAGAGSVVGPAVTSDGDGVVRAGSWTLGTRVGSSVLRARLSETPSIAVDFRATTHAGSPASIVRLSGDAQRGLVGEALPEPLSVKVVDRFDNPVSGVEVTFAVLAGGGTIGAAATTNARGVASSGRWTIGPAVTEQRVVASLVPGVAIATVEFSATAFEPCGAPCTLPGTLAFVRDGDIHVSNPDGTIVVRLTSGGVSYEPAWSPDGLRIAFTRVTKTESFQSTEILLMDADGSNVRQFAASGRSPAWSPDGRQIAFFGYVVLPQERLWTVLVASVEPVASAPIIVGFDRGLSEGPAWSPGGRIAFVSDWTAFDFAMEVHTVEADGSGRRQVTNGFGVSLLSGSTTYTTYREPAWSPDGTRFAVLTCEEWQWASCAVSSVAVMASDGSGLRILAATDGYTKPAWTPDGRISFSRCTFATSCTPTVYVIAPDGGQERVLIANAHSAAWRP